MSQPYSLRKLLGGIIVLISIGIVLFLTGLSVGPANIGLSEALQWVSQGLQGELDSNESRGTIIWQLRLPRLILAALVGASLALAGVVMQGIFRNPMADPFLLGVSGGAALGATSAMYLGWTSLLWGSTGVTAFAFVGSLGVSFAVYVLAYQCGRVPVLNLLLVGIAVGALCQGITALLLRLSPSTDVQRVFFWLMGSFASSSWFQIKGVFPYFLIAVGWLWWWARDLDLLMLGEEEAASLGLRVERSKTILMIVASILAAVAVSVSGIVGFVGLMVPHMVRLWSGPNHRPLILLSVFAGSVLLLASDLVGRLVMEFEIPVGIVTTLLGVPFFLFLLRRKQRYQFS